MISIGGLARRAGVKVPTIRYYEQAGLLGEPGRTAGNQRRYEPADLERLSFIRHARELGFGLDAIRDLLDLAAHPESPCERADQIAATQLANVRGRLERLRRLEAELERMVDHGSHATVHDCNVLRTLADHELCADEH